MIDQLISPSGSFRTELANDFLPPVTEDVDQLTDLDGPWDDDLEDTQDWFDLALVEPPLADLADDALLDDLQATHRALAGSQAREALLVTELAHRRARHAVTELTGRKARGLEALTLGAKRVGEEVAQEFAMSLYTAQNFTDTCVGLCLDTPDTLDALMTGEIDWARARVILELVQRLRIGQTDTNADLPTEEQEDPEELGREVEKRLLRKARNRTRLADLKRAGAAEMIKANPRAAEHRHRRARARRAISYRPEDDSMASLGAYLPADAGLLAKNALTRLAHHARAAHPGDQRTLDQFRIDALVEILTRAADHLHPEQNRNTADPITTPDTSNVAGCCAPLRMPTKWRFAVVEGADRG